MYQQSEVSRKFVKGLSALTDEFFHRRIEGDYPTLSGAQEAGCSGALTMANRKRDIQLHFMVSQNEMALIQKKMERMGTRNLGAYLRKMALDGYVVRLNLTDVKELVALLHNATNNLNQIARCMNESGSIYAVDVEDLHRDYDLIWDKTGNILDALAEIM